MFSVAASGVEAFSALLPKKKKNMSYCVIHVLCIFPECGGFSLCARVCVCVCVLCVCHSVVYGSAMQLLIM